MQTDESEPDLRPYGKSKSKFFGLTDAEVKQAEQWADQLGRHVRFETEHALRHELSINQLRCAFAHLHKSSSPPRRWLFVCLGCVAVNAVFFLVAFFSDPDSLLTPAFRLVPQQLYIGGALVFLASPLVLTAAWAAYAYFRSKRRSKAQTLYHIILAHKNTNQPTAN